MINLGRYGEELARKFLEKKGFKLIEKNFKTPRWGEIDLVMKDGETLVFVEVKSKSKPGAALYGGPLSTINFYKMRALKRASQFYVSSKKLQGKPARLDAVSVILDEAGKAEIEYFPHISGNVW